jgi:hypothetical protein
VLGSFLPSRCEIHCFELWFPKHRKGDGAVSAFADPPIAIIANDRHGLFSRPDEFDPILDKREDSVQSDIRPIRRAAIDRRLNRSRQMHYASAQAGIRSPADTAHESRRRSVRIAWAGVEAAQILESMGDEVDFPPSSGYAMLKLRQCEELSKGGFFEEDHPDTHRLNC